MSFALLLNFLMEHLELELPLRQKTRPDPYPTYDPYPTDQIETLCKRVGLITVAIKRIRIGRVSMKKLPPGEWRYLSVNTMF